MTCSPVAPPVAHPMLMQWYWDQRSRYRVAVRAEVFAFWRIHRPLHHRVMPCLIYHPVWTRDPVIGTTYRDPGAVNGRNVVDDKLPKALYWRMAGIRTVSTRDPAQTGAAPARRIKRLRFIQYWRDALPPSKDFLTIGNIKAEDMDDWIARYHRINALWAYYCQLERRMGGVRAAMQAIAAGPDSVHLAPRRSDCDATWNQLQALAHGIPGTAVSRPSRSRRSGSRRQGVPPGNGLADDQTASATGRNRVPQHSFFDEAMFTDGP